MIKLKRIKGESHLYLTRTRVTRIVQVSFCKSASILVQRCGHRSSRVRRQVDPIGRPFV